MNIFANLMNKILGDKEQSTAIPGAMGDLLATMGIHELGPHRRSGIPASVLGGCKQSLTLIPGMAQPAYTREGKPVMAKTKRGQTYHVQENYAIPTKRFKQMQRDQARKAAGRWYSGAQAA